MASNLDFVNYACDQMSGAGNITFKKMFGEYGIYCNDKIIGLICDNQLFIKVTEAGSRIYPNYQTASPYTNAKAHFLIDNIDNRELMTKFILATYNELPMPKPKKKKV